MHTVILFIAIFVFAFLLYATSDIVGSPSRFYYLLVEASQRSPIATNVDGSYLSFRSTDGLIFAIDLFAAGFSTVWLDQAYWQRAIASRPETSVRAYILGGVAWYGIPFAFGTAMGLGCAALTGDPSFPTYPNPLTAAQNDAGLSSPATAITVAGKGGAVLMLVLLFMAVTSATSAELIAVSSLCSFDIYKTYINPLASSAKLVTVSHIGIIVYSLVLAAFCCILNAVGLNLTWLLTILAIIVGGASIPVGLILLWKRMSTVAAIGAPWIGLVCGLIAWFVTTWKRNGEITVASTGDTTNAVAGNITSWGVGFLMSGVLTLAFPAKYSSSDLRHIERSNKIQGIAIVSPGHTTAAETSPPSDSPPTTDTKLEPEKSSPTTPPAAPPVPEAIVPTGNDVVDFLESKQIEPMDQAAVRKSERLAVGANIVFFLVAIILVPFTLFGTGYVFNQSFFTGWVVVSFIWVWTSMVICVIYPVVESAGALRELSLGILADLKALRGGKREKGRREPGEA